ncbi:MAG TPA: hypothetical protein VF071_07980 [Candidatus Limnocylindria bacterium]
MRTRPFFLLVLITLAAGCGTVASPTRPASVSEPAVLLIGDRAVFDPQDATGYGFMLPGAGLATVDGLHAWVVGFGDEPGDQELIQLASANGTDWEVSDRTVERDMGVELRPPGPIPSTVLPPDGGGQWVMYFSGSPSSGANGADLWRATAPGPTGPWTADPEPVLARTDVPTEDGVAPTQLDFPAVVRTDEGYLMLFGWSPSRATTLIRSATSADGVSWTVEGAPAIGLGLCGGFDTRSVAMPRLAPHPSGGWVALYGGFGEETDQSMALGLARSTDGQAWTCASADPALEMADIPGSTRLHSYALLAGGEEPPRLLIESLVAERSELWLAELRLE